MEQIQPSTPQILPLFEPPTFASVLASRLAQVKFTLAVQDEGADFTVVDRKKKKESTERHESKQQLQRGTGVYI